jgi:hypothetical protein
VCGSVEADLDGGEVVVAAAVARLAAGMEGFAVWNRLMSWFGVREIWWSS